MALILIKGDKGYYDVCEAQGGILAYSDTGCAAFASIADAEIAIEKTKKRHTRDCYNIEKYTGDFLLSNNTTNE